MVASAEAVELHMTPQFLVVQVMADSSAVMLMKKMAEAVLDLVVLFSTMAVLSVSLTVPSSKTG